MNKNTKKDFLQLRFDTSTDKLACFIQKKPKPTEADTNERCAKNSRKKIKSSKQKAVQFQNDAFLESILNNVFTEEFGGVQEIKQLVKQCKQVDEAQGRQEQSNCEIRSKKKAAYLEFNGQEQNQSIQDLLTPETQYKLLLPEWKNQPQHMISTRVGTEETHDHSLLDDPQSTLFSKPNPVQEPYSQQTNPQFLPNFTQCYPYYPYQPLQRKKRTVTNEEALQFRINLDNLQNDGRTTLMIRNIPNKYSQQLLLEELKHYRVKFDFFYLPIDYNNSCNVGYAFINFIHTKFILDFYSEFNGRKWSRFNSEKICSLAYARIQGTFALRNHFRNSHVMQQKDKRFRPLLNSQLDDDKRNNLSKILENQRQKI